MLFVAPVAATSLEVYGRLPQLEDAVLSPDGSRIAYVKTEGDARLVVVISLANRQTLGRLRVGEQKLRSISWADNDRLLLGTSMATLLQGFTDTFGEWFQMQVYDVRTDKPFMVPRDNSPNEQAGTLANVVLGRPVVRRVQGHTLLFIRGMETSGGLQTSKQVKLAFIRVDLETRAAHAINTGKCACADWLVDDAGEIAAEEAYDEQDRYWRILIHRAGGMEEAASGHADIEIPRLLGWGPTPDTILFGRLEEGDPIWRLLSLKDGSLGPPMAERKTLDSPIEDTRRNRMIGGVHVGDTREYVFFDPVVQESWRTVLNTFPGERVHLESAAQGFRKVIVRVEGASDGFRYMLVDLDVGHAIPVGEVYSGVTQPLEVRAIAYAAGDGLPIPAYLTLPRAKAAKNLPLIVLPHGGPAARDTADFDWWSQALADQGYAVLRPNFRGSTTNWAFMSKGFGEWGRKMQTDLSDGVRYLAKQGVVDPARVCIVGGSYGGYAALAGASLDPGVYRCVVSVAGVADLKRMLKWIHETSGTNSRAQRYWERFMGVSGPGDPALDAISPIKHVDAVHVPVLLIHGRDDTVMPFEQSQAMYDALRGANKEVELVTLKHEDHWLSRSETRLQMLEASVAFLRAHNPPDQ